MRMHVPHVGEQIQLTKNWTFVLYDEIRNTSVGKIFGLKIDESGRSPCGPVGNVTLLAGTFLTVDRVYVRKSTYFNDSSEYDSMSFFIDWMPPNNAFSGHLPRFWAKLDDVNKIEFDVCLKSTPSSKKKKFSADSLRKELHKYVDFNDLNALKGRGIIDDKKIDAIVKGGPFIYSSLANGHGLYVPYPSSWALASSKKTANGERLRIYKGQIDDMWTFPYNKILCYVIADVTTDLLDENVVSCKLTLGH